MVEFEKTPFGTRIVNLKEAMLKPFEQASELDQLRARNAELEAEVERLRKALEAAPIKLLNETDHKFLLRYKQWYRNNKAALEASDES